MAKVLGNSPLVRSLNESLAVIVEDTNRVVDSHGDTWRLFDNLVRNESHPHFDGKSKEIMKDEESGVRYETQPRGAWVNGRTGEVYHGDMRLGPDGRCYPHSWDSTPPQMHHVSHYFQVDDE